MFEAKNAKAKIKNKKQESEGYFLKHEFRRSAAVE